MLQPPPLPRASPSLLVGGLPPAPQSVATSFAPPPPPAAVEAEAPAEPTMQPVVVIDNTPEEWQEFTSMAVSMAVHVVVLLTLAVFVPLEQIREPAVQLVSSIEEPELAFEETEMLPIETPPVQLDELDEQLPEISSEVAEPDVSDIDTAGTPDSSAMSGFAGPLASAAGADAMLADFGTVRAGGGPGGGGGFGGEIGKRLTKAGAQTGVIQISLSWNNYNDLDLHVVPPSGERIFFNHRRSRCGGNLDVDMNAGGRASNEPVENVYWPRQLAPMGRFQVFVHHFAQHDDDDETPFELHVLVDGVKHSYKGMVSSDKPMVLVNEFLRKRGAAASTADDEGFSE